MSWFRRQQRLDHKVMLRWLFSINSSSDVTKIRELRKQVQAGMLSEIAMHLLKLETHDDEQTAYLLIHFFSGRAMLPAFAAPLLAQPAAARRAEQIFRSATASPWPSEQFEVTAVYNCCLEVTNEAIERQYLEALALSNHGVRFWPLHGELWRERGVLKLAFEDYVGAIADLREAGRLKPEMQWLREPIEFAEGKLSR